MLLLLLTSLLLGKLRTATVQAGVRFRIGTGPHDRQVPGSHMGNGEACGFLCWKNQPEAVGTASVPITQRLMLAQR